MNEFERYHPIVNFIYFTLVLVFSMFFMHPILLVISAVGGCVYYGMLRGIKALLKRLILLLPILALAAILNPLFNHQGVTILAYLPGGNPLTKESLVYGLFAALMLFCVILWFSCYNIVMTSDKFIYLFGRIAPNLSLIFSMTLRFVPRFLEQFKQVLHAQRCIVSPSCAGGLRGRVKYYSAIVLSMLGWALENSIETADSMRSRGYGLKKRSFYSIYRIEKRDIIVLAIIILLAGYIFTLAASAKVSAEYFPAVNFDFESLYAVSVFAAYILLCAMPIVIGIREVLRWK